MDSLFDFQSIFELLKIEPGSGLLQSFLLFMIWMQSRGVRKELAAFTKGYAVDKSATEVRLGKIEGRLTILEGGK